MSKLNFSKSIIEAYQKASGFGPMYEAVLKADPEFTNEAWHLMEEQAKRNPFFQLVKTFGIKEGLFSSDAGALGFVYATVSDMSQPNTLGRELLEVIPTTEPTLRYPKAKTRAKAQKISEKSPLLLGEKYTYEDIDCDIEIATGEKWTQSFLEDAKWNVLARQVEAIGKGLAYTETEDVVALYNAITAADLAGGSQITLTDPITWTEFLSLLEAVDNEDFVPRVVAVSPEVWYELFTLTEFINSVYVTSEKGLKPNVMKVIAPNDLTIVKSSLVTKTLVIDTEAAAVMALRRDAMIRPYEDPKALEYGVVGSERYGLKVLRANAVARGSR